MQQLLVAIVQQFPHQALWAMAVVVKSTIRARQVCAGLKGTEVAGAQARLWCDSTCVTDNVSN